MKKVDIEKTCSYCKHAKIFGMHAVKIQCDIDNKEMCGYLSDNAYRTNAKDCPHFDANGHDAWSNELQVVIKSKNINWI